MKRASIAFAVCLTLWCFGTCYAQTSAAGGGFREVLNIVGLGPDVIRQLDADDLADDDWQVLAQILGRLKQHDDDLKRWTLAEPSISPESIGELMKITGVVESVQELTTPATVADRSELTTLYRCRMRTDSGSSTVISANVPRRWNLSESLSESVSFVGVLLRDRFKSPSPVLRGGARGGVLEVGKIVEDVASMPAPGDPPLAPPWKREGDMKQPLNDEEPLLLATHVSWFPTSGVPSGQLLLARHGMDAALWEEIVQRTAFIAPEKGREAEAFYSGLAALRRVNPQELVQLTREHVEESVATADPGDPKLAAAIAEQAELGLSSVVPLFLQPEKHVGELVRIEGTARRAVRVAVDGGENLMSDEPIRDYYELEVFTPDSQNYPVVCCVTKLPAEFPLGDAIRTRVRVDGVFFKLWRYRSRELVAGPGETATQKRGYTPIILGGLVTWLQQAPPEHGWWGLVVGGFVFAIIMIGLARVILSERNDRRDRLPDVLPDHVGE